MQRFTISLDDERGVISHRGIDSRGGQEQCDVRAEEQVSHGVDGILGTKAFDVAGIRRADS